MKYINNFSSYIKESSVNQEGELIENYKIELDCPPGSPRPDDLLPIVIEGTGLTMEDFTCTSRLFGNWTFELNPSKNTK